MTIGYGRAVSELAASALKLTARHNIAPVERGKANNGGARDSRIAPAHTACSSSCQLSSSRDEGWLSRNTLILPIGAQRRILVYPERVEKSPVAQFGPMKHIYLHQHTHCCFFAPSWDFD